MADEIRLVGGTFVTILEQYRKDKDENRNKILKGKFVSNFLVALGFDEKDCGDISTAQATHFTRCDSRTFGESFLKPSNLDSLAFSISNHWKDVSIFFENFMTENAAMKVVAALKEMIESDDLIVKTDRFLLSEDASITKEDVSKMKAVPYIPFITGVAIFSLKKANVEGRNTIEKWCNYAGKDHAKTDIGKKYWYKISDDASYIIKRAISSSESNRKENSYGIDEADYKALDAQSKNEERDRKDLCLLLNTIDEKKKLYVKTSVYRNTYRKILDNGYVMLTGNPGTGKTMTSQLIALAFAGIGYTVHYLREINENEVNKVDEAISSKSAKSELHFILIDDCMGQSVYKLSEEKESCFSKFVAYIKRNTKRIKLLLNSRISVIEGAKKHRIYEEVISEMEEKGAIINANNLSNKDKALILRSHLVVRTDEAHYNDIKDHNLIGIVKHKSFIPRVIYYAMDRCRLHPIDVPGNFSLEIIKALENPEPIWDDIYNDVISPESEILLKTLYSLTDNMIDAKCCRQVFDKYLQLAGINNPRKAFDKALKQLNNSMVKRVVAREEMIGFVDPSIHDYLSKSVYKAGSEEYKELYKTIFHRNQVDKLLDYPNSYRFINEHVKKGTIFELDYFHEDERALDIINSVAYGHYCYESYRNIFNETLEKFNRPYSSKNYTAYCSCTLFSYPRTGYEMLESLLKDGKMRDFYCNGKISRYVFDCCTAQFDIYYVSDLLPVIYGSDLSCLDFELTNEIIRALIRKSCKNTVADYDNFIFQLVDACAYDSDKLDEYNGQVNDLMYEKLCDLAYGMGPDVPEELCSIMLEEIQNFGFFGDHKEEIAEKYEGEKNSDSGESKLKEKIVANDDDSDKAILDVFDAPFPKKEQ